MKGWSRVSLNSILKCLLNPQEQTHAESVTGLRSLNSKSFQSKMSWLRLKTKSRKNNLKLKKFMRNLSWLVLEPMYSVKMPTVMNTGTLRKTRKEFTLELKSQFVLRPTQQQAHPRLSTTSLLGFICRTKISTSSLLRRSIQKVSGRKSFKRTWGR